MQQVVKNLGEKKENQVYFHKTSRYIIYCSELITTTFCQKQNRKQRYTFHLAPSAILLPHVYRVGQVVVTLKCIQYMHGPENQFYSSKSKGKQRRIMKVLLHGCQFHSSTEFKQLYECAVMYSHVYFPNQFDMGFFKLIFTTCDVQIMNLSKYGREVCNAKITDI